MLHTGGTGTHNGGPRPRRVPPAESRPPGCLQGDLDQRSPDQSHNLGTSPVDTRQSHRARCGDGWCPCVPSAHHACVTQTICDDSLYALPTVAPTSSLVSSVAASAALPAWQPALEAPHSPREDSRSSHTDPAPARSARPSKGFPAQL